MIKLDENLLAELGLAQLPREDKAEFLKHMYETLELRVGTRLAERMSESQMSEFERYISGNDEQGAFQWLEGNFPDYKDVVADEFERLKVEIKPVAAHIVEASVASGQPVASERRSDESQHQPAVGQGFREDDGASSELKVDHGEHDQQGVPQTEETSPSTPPPMMPPQFGAPMTPPASEPEPVADAGQDDQKNFMTAFESPAVPTQPEPAQEEPASPSAPLSPFAMPTPPASEPAPSMFGPSPAGQAPPMPMPPSPNMTPEPMPSSPPPFGAGPSQPGTPSFGAPQPYQPGSMESTQPSFGPGTPTGTGGMQGFPQQPGGAQPGYTPYGQPAGQSGQPGQFGQQGPYGQPSQYGQPGPLPGGQPPYDGHQGYGQPPSPPQYGQPPQMPPFGR